MDSEATALNLTHPQGAATWRKTAERTVAQELPYYEPCGASLGRAGSEFYSGIQPAMFVAPSLTFVTNRIALLNRPTPAGIPGLAAVLTLMAFLAGCPRFVCPQEAAPQFDDLAARASAARDQGNIPEAIELYGKAEQLKPDWAEGL